MDHLLNTVAQNYAAHAARTGDSNIIAATATQGEITKEITRIPTVKYCNKGDCANVNEYDTIRDASKTSKSFTLQRV